MPLTKHTFLLRVKRLPGGKLWAFAIRQAWAALFGGLMIGAIILTKYVELPWLARYDWLFLFAIAIQIFMLLSKLEKPHEVLTILLFHLVGLGMELLKPRTAHGLTQSTLSLRLATYRCFRASCMPLSVVILPVPGAS